MLYSKVECPHCGNEITVNNAKKEDKCRWCRRLISVSFNKNKKNKIDCEVKPLDFPDESNFLLKNRKDNFDRF